MAMILIEASDRFLKNEVTSQAAYSTLALAWGGLLDTLAFFITQNQSHEPKDPNEPDKFWPLFRQATPRRAAHQVDQADTGNPRKPTAHAFKGTLTPGGRAATGKDRVNGLVGPVCS